MELEEWVADGARRVSGREHNPNWYQEDTRVNPRRYQNLTQEGTRKIPELTQEDTRTQPNRSDEHTREIPGWYKEDTITWPLEIEQQERVAGKSEQMEQLEWAADGARVLMGRWRYHGEYRQRPRKPCYRHPMSIKASTLLISHQSLMFHPPMSASTLMISHISLPTLVLPISLHSLCRTIRILVCSGITCWSSYVDNFFPIHLDTWVVWAHAMCHFRCTEQHRDQYSTLIDDPMSMQR